MSNFLPVIFKKRTKSGNACEQSSGVRATVICQSSSIAIITSQANRGYMPTILSAGNNEAGGRFGSAMAAAGDLNGDGFNDIIVGAPFLDDYQGAVFVFHGSDFGIDPDFKQVCRVFLARFRTFSDHRNTNRKFF